MSLSSALAQSTIEATTIRKLQTHIIPFVFVLFVINFVDRINIGFAALTMNRELAITSQQFGLLSGTSFWGYFIFEIPSNLLLHKLGARIWIARILVSWGIVAILTGFVRSATHLWGTTMRSVRAALSLLSLRPNSSPISAGTVCFIIPATHDRNGQTRGLHPC